MDDVKEEKKDIPKEENEGHKDKHRKEVETLKNMNQLLESKNKELQDKLLRDQAELQNFKRRRDEETARFLKYCNEDIIKELLPILDNLERAINNESESSTIIDGIKMIYASFVNTLKNFGVSEIEALNKPFDPLFQQAVSTTEKEDTENDMVVEVLQKGYMLIDKIIRPAMVVVNKNERKGEDENE